MSDIGTGQSGTGTSGVPNNWRPSSETETYCFHHEAIEERGPYSCGECFHQWPTAAALIKDFNDDM